MEDNMGSTTGFWLLWMFFLMAPAELLGMESKEELIDLTKDLIYGHDEKECGICVEEYKDDLLIALLPCGHFVCSACGSDYSKNSKTCPHCRKGYGSSSEFFHTQFKNISTKNLSVLFPWKISHLDKKGAFLQLTRLKKAQTNKQISEHDVLAIINAADNEGRTFLHHAVIKQSKKLVSALIDAKANKDAKDGNGKTPYDLAVMRRYSAIRNILNPTPEELPRKTDGLILDFKAKKRTMNFHWFPIRETQAGGDPINNLYSQNGPLDKLDRLTGGHARSYEYIHHRKCFDAGHEYVWWGHSNSASEAACLLQAPKRPVIMTAKDGALITFTENDIQGLLVKVIGNLIGKTDFAGERFNYGESLERLTPKAFLDTLFEWSKDGLPFVIGIEGGEQIWNFPYDHVKIYQSGTHYRIDISSTGFENKFRTYRIVDNKWSKTADSHDPPRFMWRTHPRGDVTDKQLWQKHGPQNNPEIDPQVVYEIYMESLK